MVMMPAFVDGPPAAAQRGGLATNALPGDKSVDWLKGVQWWPEDVAGYQLASECSSSVTNHGSVGYTRPVMAQPTLIRTNVQSPKSSHLDLRERAKRRLEGVTSQALARELWLGEQAQASPFGMLGSIEWSNPSPSSGQFTNPYLAMTPAVTVSGSLDPAEGLAAVEEACGELVTGGPVFLHVPHAILTQLGALLTVTGNVIQTVAGSYVIADHGYPGPSGGVAAIYGTGPVMAWVGDPEVYDDPSEYLRVSDNHIEVWADRPALAIFDPLSLVAATVTP